MEPSDQYDLLLVDSRHMLWRAASVFHDLHVERQEGIKLDTGGIYGWLRITMATRFKFGGTVIACWDRTEGPTERRKLYAEYKNKPKKPPKPIRKREPKPANDAPDDVDGYNASATFNASNAAVEREIMLESMREQEVTLKQLLTTLGVRQWSSPGWEADDVIATLCRRFDGHRIAILSGDRDLLQLVTATTHLIRPQPKGMFDVFDLAKVRQDFQLAPKQILDFKALSGDSSDNIPGAKGIGPKTATQLLQEHHTWQQCLTWAANSTTTSKTAQKLVASQELVELSAKLVKLNDRAPLDFIEPKLDRKRAMLDLASLKFQSLLTDGRREQLMAMG